MSYVCVWVEKKLQKVVTSFWGASEVCRRRKVAAKYETLPSSPTLIQRFSQANSELSGSLSPSPTSLLTDPKFLF